MEKQNNSDKQIKLSNLFNKHSCIGLVGNRSTAKTSLVIDRLMDLRKEFPHLKIAVMGLNEELYPLLEKNHIRVVESKMDVLDLQMRDTIIFIDEMALFFDTQSRSKQLDKLMRFFDRIEHQNCKILMGTAREGYFNKFMCSRVTAFLVKQIEYDALVNGTWLKERVKAIKSNSDYRLMAEKKDYFVVTAGDGTFTTKHNFPYTPEYDTKKTNLNLFDKGIKEDRETEEYLKIYDEKNENENESEREC